MYPSTSDAIDAPSLSKSPRLCRTQILRSRWTSLACGLPSTSNGRLENRNSCFCLRDGIEYWEYRLRRRLPALEDENSWRRNINLSHRPWISCQKWVRLKLIELLHKSNLKLKYCNIISLTTHKLKIKNYTKHSSVATGILTSTAWSISTVTSETTLPRCVLFELYFPLWGCSIALKILLNRAVLTRVLCTDSSHAFPCLLHLPR